MEDMFDGPIGDSDPDPAPIEESGPNGFEAGIEEMPEPMTPEEAGAVVIAEAVLSVKEVEEPEASLKKTNKVVDFMGAQISDLSYDFIKENLKPLMPKHKIRRIITGPSSERWYFFMKDDLPVWHLGVTNFISRYMKPSVELLKWQMKKFASFDEMMEYLNREAGYGTFFHKLAGEYLQTRPWAYTDKELGNSIQDYWHSESIDPAGESLKKWIRTAKQDMVGIAHWTDTYNVQPIAIEISLACEEMGLGGSPDLIAQLTVPMKKAGKKVKGEFEDIIAMVDWKKRRTNFYDSDIIQGMIYVEMWNRLFPQIPEIIHFYNYHCHDFKLSSEGFGKSVVPYKFKEQDLNHPILRPQVDGWLRAYLEMPEYVRSPKFPYQIKGGIMQRDSEIPEYRLAGIAYEAFDINAYIKEYDEFAEAAGTD